MPRRERKFDLEGYEVADPARAYLGEGTYGTVYLAKEIATGQFVAIKQHHNIAHEKGISSTVLRETTLLNLLKKSPYVVKLLKVVHVQGRSLDQPLMTYMVFEHLQGDLLSYAGRHRPLASDVVQRIMYHVLLGLHHCQSVGMMHRDLKPQNILLDSTNPDKPNAKLADFGFGRTFRIPIRELTEEIITIWYRPPEVLLGFQGHSPAVDIWSAACILAELYENVTLFRGTSQFDQLVKIFRALGTPEPEVWNGLVHCSNWHDYPVFGGQNLRDTLTSTPLDAIDLLETMLVHDPSKRSSAWQCLHHPYFASILNEEDLTMEPLFRSDFVGSPPPTQASSVPAQLPTQTQPPFDGIFCAQAGTL